MLHTETSNYLMELRQYFFSRKKKGWADAANIGVECKTELQIIDELLQECESTAEAFEVFRRQYGPSLCSLCTCLLLFKAIETVLPDDEVRIWMESPNLDLHDQTPLDCIHEGLFEPVFEALWLMDTTAGPAS